MSRAERFAALADKYIAIAGEIQRTFENSVILYKQKAALAYKLSDEARILEEKLYTRNGMYLMPAAWKKSDAEEAFAEMIRAEKRAMKMLDILNRANERVDNALAKASAEESDA